MIPNQTIQLNFQEKELWILINSKTDDFKKPLVLTTKEIKEKLISDMLPTDFKLSDYLKEFGDKLVEHNYINSYRITKTRFYLN